MPSLRELQEAFLEGVLGNDDQPLTRHILAAGLPGRRRLQVYRNNIRASLTQALKCIYGVVGQLVGANAFRQTAHAYTREHPSVAGTLHHYGKEFPEFLATLPNLASLPYLPDVARLEWARHEVFHAAEHVEVNLARLASLAPAQQENLHFRLQPTVRLIASPYPILRIWEVNQPNYQGDDKVSLAEGGTRILVFRRGWQVLMQCIETGEFTLLQAFQTGIPLAEAYAQTLAVAPNFDLTQALRKYVVENHLAYFTTS